MTTSIALAVGRADAARVLVPMNRLTAHKRCDNRVAGIRDVPLAELVRDAVRQIDAVCAQTEDAPGGNV